MYMRIVSETDTDCEWHPENMEDSSRWNRRKQLKPRRKNEEDVAVAEQDMQADCAPSRPDHPTPPPGPPCSPPPPQEEATTLTAERVDTPPQADAPHTPTPSPTPTAPTTDITTDTVMETEPSPVTETKESEEESLEELMKRSDTAVIFPEPVSDHDDDPEEPVSCPQCESKFDRLWQLKEHWNSAHGGQASGKYVCAQCGICFLLKSQLDKHLAVHNIPNPVCRICKKTFANVYRLQRHMISHEESTELRKFKCTECGKAFKFKHHLKEHTRIHSGEKPFECPNCGKRFSHSGSYSSHMTSKKCWMDRLKMRNGTNSVNNSSNTPTKPSDNTEGVMRPLVAKANENGLLDMSMPALYAAGLYPPGQPFLPFDPSTASQLQSQMHTVLAAHMNGNFNPVTTATAPFLPPHLSFPHSQMMNSMMPGLPAGAQPFPFMGARVTESIKAKKVVRENDTRKCEESVDENQNKGQVTEDAVTPMDHSVSASDNSKEDGDRSDKDSGIGNENGKDLDKQEEVEDEESKLVIDEHCGERTSSEVGGLSTLAAAAADQLQQLQQQQQQQQQQEQETRQHSCRHCSTVCDNAIELHQHERYLCKHNQEIPHIQHTTTTAHSGHLPVNNAAHGRSRSPTDIKPNPERGSNSQCKYCKESFTSPVELHQHERYLCKLNTDIVPVSNAESVMMSLSQATKVQGSIKLELPDAEDSSHDDSLADSETRRCRARSMISEEQLSVLKAFYQTNPRPNKFELERLATQIGFPKRVVQVWFQNMRARDRRKGRSIPDHPSSTSALSPLSTCSQSGLMSAPCNLLLGVAPTSVASAPYIPVVPHVPFSHAAAIYTSPGMSNVSSQISPPAHQHAPAQPIPATGLQAEPLDLSTGRQQLAPRAHTNGYSLYSPETTTSDSEVLNLSLKVPSTVLGINPNKYAQLRSKNGIAASPTIFQKSAIFKYMEEEGLVSDEDEEDEEEGRSGGCDTKPLPHSSNPAAIATPTPPPAHCKTYMSSLGLRSISESFPSPHDRVLTSTPNHHADCGSPTMLTPGSPSGTSSGMVSPGGSLDNSFSSTLSGDASSSKPKRARRKSWRQVGENMESEEYRDMEMDDGCIDDDEDDDENSLRKKRRSWKQHRVESGDGMFGLYMCDQCDKKFSKQSSLARHKYEHSGQRPFPCDICGKAFKHKHHLTEHKRLHSGEKPFQCKKCGKRFSHSGSYSQHMNHRYKYCKPLRMALEAGENPDTIDDEMEC